MNSFPKSAAIVVAYSQSRLLTSFSLPGGFDAVHYIPQGRTVAPFAATRRKHDSRRSEFSGAGVRFRGGRCPFHRARLGIPQPVRGPKHIHPLPPPLLT